MKKRMKILAFLLAGAMMFTSAPGTGMLAQATGTVVAEAAAVDFATQVDLSGATLVLDSATSNQFQVGITTAGGTAITSEAGDVASQLDVVAGYTGSALNPIITLGYHDGANLVSLTRDVDFSAEYVSVTGNDANGYKAVNTINNITNPGTYGIRIKGLTGVDATPAGATATIKDGVTLYKANGDAIANVEALVAYINGDEATNKVYKSKGTKGTSAAITTTYAAAATLYSDADCNTQAFASGASLTAEQVANIGNYYTAANTAATSAAVTRTNTVNTALLNIDGTSAKAQNDTVADNFDPTQYYTVAPTAATKGANDDYTYESTAAVAASGLTGEALIVFKVGKVNISTSADVKVTNAYQYLADPADPTSAIALVENDGTKALPSLAVKWGTQDLVLDKDYTLTTDAVDGSRGEYTATITPKQNNAYLDSATSKTVTYRNVTTITAANITVDYTGAGPYTASIVVQKNGEVFPEKVGQTFDGNDANTGYTVTYHEVDPKTGVAKEATVAATALAEGDYIAKVSGTGCLYTGNNAAAIEVPFSVSATAKDLSAAITAGDVNVEYTYSNNVYTGGAVEPSVQLTDKAGNKLDGYKVIYSNNVEVCTGTSVYSSGSNTLANVGNLVETAPTITIVGDGKTYKGTAKYGFEITPARITNASITGTASATYDPAKDTGSYSFAPTDIAVTLNGNTVDPANYTVEIYEAEKTNGEWNIKDTDADGDLADETDYTQGATYLVNAGTYIVIVKPVADKALSAAPGELKTTFTLEKADLSKYVATVNGGTTITATAAQSGQDIVWTSTTPAETNEVQIALKTSAAGNAKDISAGLDTQFTVSAAKFKAGENTVTVRAAANGNYTGSVEAKYTVNQQVALDDIHTYTTLEENADGTYTYTPHVTVQSGNTTLVEGTDYTVKYYEAEFVAGEAAPTTGLTETTKITDTAKFHYAEVSPAGYYQTTSPLATPVIHAGIATPEYNAAKDMAKAEVTITGTHTYDATAPTTLSPSQITVKIGNATIAAGDYVLTYANNDKAGTATVTVVPTGGGYTGVKEATFVVNPAKIPAVDNVTDQFVFDGTVKTVDLTFESGTKDLKLGTDYTVKYYKAVLGGSNGDTPQLDADGKNYQLGDEVTEIKEAGKYIVVATGITNYTDTTQAVVVVDPTTFGAMGKFDKLPGTRYTGKAQVPVITYTDNDGAAQTLDSSLYTYILKDSKGYTVSEALLPDTYTIALTGTGTSIDKLSTTNVAWTIEKANMSDLTVKVADAELTGESVEPEVTVTLGGEPVDASEYVVTYANNTAAGTGIATVTAAANSQILAAGSTSATFTITAEGEKTPDQLKEELEEANNKLQEEINKNTANQEKIDDLTAQIEELKKQLEELGNQTPSQQLVEQKITVTKKKKSFKANSLKSQKGTFNIKAAAQTDLSYKTMKANNKVTVKANGKVVVKKGTKAGTYKVRVRAIAAKSDVFKKAINNFTVTVVVK